ncbi:hypothetical protein [Flectobacillus roseus]|uniref:hypothetical protein n=1 Tax=Flectobacillus roseus TaxID=502259 RepID=UPI0024B7603E|nr:hypothetical protein [Flectobacillus roseus]MDI9872237.1 hypothetical protein [Flectobacillus roseus]
MPQVYLVAIVLILGAVKDLWNSINIGEDTKRYIRYALLAFGLYKLFKLIQTETNKKKALADVSGGLAVELHNAVYAQAVDVWGYHLGNADEDAIMEIATRIFDIGTVSSFYKNLYSADLFADLEKVLSGTEYQKFNQIVQQNAIIAKNNPQVLENQNGTDKTTIPTQKVINWKAGDAVYLDPNLTTKLNVRDPDNTGTVLYMAYMSDTYIGVSGSGYIGDFIGYKTFYVNGIKYNGAVVDIPWSKQNFSFGQNGLVAIDFCKKG